MTRSEYEERQRLGKLIPESEFSLETPYRGWARNFVEAERPIPEAFREAFYEELTSSHSVEREKLVESVKWFGVRWQK